MAPLSFSFVKYPRPLSVKEGVNLLVLQLIGALLTPSLFLLYI